MSIEGSFRTLESTKAALNDANIRVIFREHTNMYFDRLTALLLTWQTVIGADMGTYVEAQNHWIHVMAQTAQLHVSVPYEGGSKPKQQQLLTEFRLGKVWRMLVEHVFAIQLPLIKSRYTALFVHENGPKILKALHEQTRKLTQRWLKLNESDLKLVVKRVTHWCLDHVPGMPTIYASPGTSAKGNGKDSSSAPSSSSSSSSHSLDLSKSIVSTALKVR